MIDPAPFRRRLARGTAAAVFTNGWAMALTFASVPLMLGGLGRQTFGIWILVQTFSATNGWLSVPALGLGVSATRAVAAAFGANDEQVVGRALGATTAAFIAVGVLMGIPIALFGGEALQAAFDLDGGATLDRVARAFGMQVAAEFAFLAGVACLEGLQRVGSARLLDAGRRTVFVATTVVVARQTADLDDVAVAAATASVLAAVVALGAVLLVGGVRPVRPAGSEVTGLVQYALTSGALTATGVLHRTMDRVIAGVVLGPAAVSLVEVAAQVQAGCTALLSATTYPVISAAPWLRARDDRSALVDLVERAGRYGVLTTLPLVVGAFVLAGPFVRTWVDQPEAIGLTQVAVLYVAIVSPLQAGSNALQGLGLAKSVLRASFVSVAVNLAVSVVLVQTVGLVGVFIGTIAGALVLVPLLGRSIVEHAGLPGFGAIALPVIASIPPSLALGAVSVIVLALPLADVPTLVIAGAGGVLAAGLSAFRWSFPADERQQLRRALFR